MAPGTVQFETNNIFINADKATINQQLNVEGDSIFFSNPVYFRVDEARPFEQPRIPTDKIQYSGHEVSIQCYFNKCYDTFWLCEDPLLNLYITFYGGNHIVQFEVMTQEDLDMEPGDGFGFSLNFEYYITDININKPFNFEPGKKYMIIFQREYEDGNCPINIFWTELTDYAN